MLRRPFPRNSRRAIICAGVLLACSCAYTQTPTVQAPQGGAALFAENVDGFQHFVYEIVRLYKNAEKDKLNALLREATLPDSAAWWVDVFDKEVGQSLARAYAMRRTAIEPLLLSFLKEARNVNPPEIEIVVSTGTKVELGGKPPKVLGGRFQTQRALTIYSTRFQPSKKKKDHSQAGLLSFVYVEGAFRFLGLPEIDCRIPAPATAYPAPQIRVAGSVQHPKLIRQVNPVYSELAIRASIQSIVRLQILVDRQGCVRQLNVLSGHPLLIQSVLDAVRDWVYLPTIYNGQPVEVVTTVDISFSRGR